jgi:SSS family solute:Na+ symporter
VGIYFWCTNQFVIQRALGARSLDHGRWGALLAGALKLPNLFILILPGVMATVLYPELDRPDMVFPLLAFDLLPPGLRGIILAALAAAILSSLEAILNSASTLFTMDFVKDWKPDLPESRLVLTGQLTTLAFMFMAAAWAPQIAHFPTLWQYLQSVLSYVTPPVVAVFLGGVFWPRSTEAGAFWTLALGTLIGTLGWIGVEFFGLFDLQYLYASGVMLFVSVAILVAISLLTPPPDPGRLAGLLWREASHESGGPGDQGGEPGSHLGKMAASPRSRRLLFWLLSGALLVAAATILAWWW